MPERSAPTDTSLLSPGLVAAYQASETQWVPGPIELPDYSDVLLGKLFLPFGPRRIELRHAPVISEQLTLNAIFRYDMGFLPNSYTLEGYANGADPAAMQLIIAQFGPSDPLASIPLIVPIMSIADMVTLIAWNPYIDASGAWKEPYYHLEVKSSAGGYTDLIAGVAPVQ